MKIKMFLLCLLIQQIYATEDIFYVIAKKENFIVFENQTIIYNGTPLRKINSSIYKIEGYRGKKPDTLYATKNLKLLLAQSPLIKTKNDKAVLFIKIPSQFLTKNHNLAWEKEQKIFHKVCTKCHSLDEPQENTMDEWKGLYERMIHLANPTPKQDKQIRRFLQAHAQDGIIK